MSDHSVSLFKRIDALVYSLEQRVVTVAAMLMTTSVCLDIVFRSLKGQQSEPFASLMSGFGLLSEQRAGLETKLIPVVLLIVLPFFFGWAVYASLHRGEEGNLRRALVNGALWSIGGLLGSLFVYQVPSRFVCSILALFIGGLITMRAAGIERVINVVLTLLVIRGCLSLPQDYIWSQELSLILLAWVAFLGASMATYKNKHIQISALSGLIPAKAQPYIRPIGLIATAMFSAYISLSLISSVFGDKGSFSSGESRPATGIPAWVILFSGVVSFSLITLRSFAYGLWSLRDPQKQDIEEELH